MTTALQVSAQKELRRLIDQIERLEVDKQEIANDIRDKLTEAKHTGFDVKVLRKLLALRKLSQAEREESEAILETYIHAVGWDSTPLGKAAERPQLAVV